ncbi:MAG: 50S ribosomal protein L15 [Dehalococcoidia bacterium]
MHISDLRPVPGSVHKKKRVGRGNASGKGTTGGRGTKGQQSRSGPDLRIHFEGGQNPLARSLSRLRGFNNKWRVEYEPINIADIADLAANSVVTPASLRAAGIVKSTSMPVKILGDGEISVALDISAERFSASARAKIEAAGGKVTELAPKVVSETGKKAGRRQAGATEAASHTATAAEAPAAAESTEKEAED